MQKRCFCQRCSRLQPKMGKQKDLTAGDEKIKNFSGLAEGKKSLEIAK